MSGIKANNAKNEMEALTAIKLRRLKLDITSCKIK